MSLGSFQDPAVISGTVTVESEFPTAAAAADNMANPTTTNVITHGMLYDGATWDRARGDSTDGALVNLGANNDVTVTSVTGGSVAHDSADSGNPIKIGGRAVNAEISPVANNDRTDFVTDLTGKQIVLPYSNPENMLIGTITTAMTGTTSTAVSGMGAPGAGLRNYITSVIISNSHATVGTNVVLQDGSGGTTIGTFPAAATYGGVAIALPTPLRQPTTNTALYAANVTTGASVKVTCYGYKGA